MSSDEDEGSGSIPRVLARNTACHQCRKRKLKCDAVKPTCTNCQRHNNRQANASNPRPLDCTWDEPRRRRQRGEGVSEEAIGAKRAKMAELEAKIADFEKVLKSREHDPTISATTAQSLPNEAWKSGEGGEASTGLPLYRALPENILSRQGFPLGGSALQDGVSISANSFNQGGQYAESRRSSEHMDLVWPNWPVDLPALDVIEHVVDVFFERVPILPCMMHQSSFKANLQLPPTHWKFPARPLLHAILAVTANHLPVELLATRRYFPTGTPSCSLHHPEYDFEQPRVQERFFPLGAFHTQPQLSDSSKPSAFARFQLWHRRKAMASLTVHLDKGEKLLECAQANVITATVDQYNAWWTDLWMLSGSAMRMAIPVQLNESPKRPRDALLAGQNVLLAPAQDALEQACRDRTWWMIYLLERSVTLSTCWSPSLPDSEITVELPVRQDTFDRGWGDLEGVQSFQSPNFYSDHPERHEDSLVFYIKAIRLVTELSSFLRSYSRTSHTVSKYTNEPRIRLLLSNINAFRLSFPPRFRRPAQLIHDGPPDVAALAAIMLTHMVTVMIGEPLITKDTWESDLARMALTAIRASLSLLYDITATSFDLTLLPCLCAFCWGVAGGALCRFIVAATETGDTVSAEVFRSEVQVFRMAMQQYAERYPIGQRNMKMLDETLEMTGPGAKMSDVFTCAVHEVLDPDYIPGSLKSVPSASVSTPSGSGGTQQSSSQAVGRDVPDTPAAAFLHQTKLQSRRQIMHQSAGRSGTDTGPSASPSIDTAPQANVVTPPDELIRQDSTNMYATSTTQSYGFTQTSFETGPFPGVSGTADPTWGQAFVQAEQFPQSTQQDQQQQQQQQQNLMATAMSMGADPNSDFGMGGDFGGFGFDINNFSFDIGDFGSLLGNTQGPGDQNKAYGF